MSLAYALAERPLDRDIAVQFDSLDEAQDFIDKRPEFFRSFRNVPIVSLRAVPDAPLSAKIIRA